MTVVSYKRGDTAPDFVCVLLDGTTPVDLTAASVRIFVRRVSTGVLVVDAAGAIVAPATDGRVRYEWGAADLAASGGYVAEWEVTFSDGKIQTFPGRGHLTLEVTDDLGDAP